MSAARVIADSDFGMIVIRTRVNARNISMHVRKDGLHVTVPPYTRTDNILRVVSGYRTRLLEQFVKVSPKLLSDGFSIDAPCFKLSVLSGKSRVFSVRRKDEGMMEIVCPEDTDFSSQAVQKLLRAAIVRAMKKCAGEHLPEMVEFWAGRFGMTFRKVRITGARSRWGSCTSRGTISLSCYLMLLPVHLMDYVILHELAHTRQMNHGPEFWKLLDDMTEGNALALRKELRKFSPDF